MKPDVVSLSVTKSWTGGAQEAALERIVAASRKIRALVILGGRIASVVRVKPGVLDAVHCSSRELLGFLDRYDRNNNGSRGKQQ